jgi:hypothetical protein
MLVASDLGEGESVVGKVWWWMIPIRNKFFFSTLNIYCFYWQIIVGH